MKVFFQLVCAALAVLRVAVSGTALQKASLLLPAHNSHTLTRRNSSSSSSLSSALDSRSGTKVAIKKLYRPFQSELFAKRAYRELRLLKHMKHENVRRVAEVKVQRPRRRWAVYDPSLLLACNIVSLAPAGDWSAGCVYRWPLAGRLPRLVSVVSRGCLRGAALSWQWPLGFWLRLFDFLQLSSSLKEAEVFTFCIQVKVQITCVKNNIYILW